MKMRKRRVQGVLRVSTRTSSKTAMMTSTLSSLALARDAKLNKETKSELRIHLSIVNQRSLPWKERNNKHQLKNKAKKFDFRETPSKKSII